MASYAGSHLNENISIGRYCSIASGLIILGGRHPIEALTSSSVMYDKRFSLVKYLEDKLDFKHPCHPNKQKPFNIVIGNDVWIGSRVTLPRNVRIGDGAVIAADSVITKDVPPYAIVGGNPAKIIKYRFDEMTINLLLTSKWWEYAPKDISSLNMSDPVQFLRQFREAELSPFTPEVVTFADLEAFREK